MLPMITIPWYKQIENTNTEDIKMDEKITEALRQVKDYCEKTECQECKYSDGHKCLLAGSPTGWTLPEAKNKLTIQ